jgi:hypothetical protein
MCSYDIKQIRERKVYCKKQRNWIIYCIEDPFYIIFPRTPRFSKQTFPFLLQSPLHTSFLVSSSQRSHAQSDTMSWGKSDQRQLLQLLRTFEFVRQFQLSYLKPTIFADIFIHTVSCNYRRPDTQITPQSLIVYTSTWSWTRRSAATMGILATQWRSTTRTPQNYQHNFMCVCIYVVQTACPLGPQSLLSSGYRSLDPRRKSSRSVKLTIHLHLVLRSRMRGAIYPVPHTSSYLHLPVLKQAYGKSYFT